MTLRDDPRAWILRLFEMEERERGGSDCARFPEGVSPPGLPLKDGERVFGIYKERYHFTPASLIILDRSNVTRIPWADVQSCSSQHGEGKTFSDLTLVNRRAVRVRVGDMAKGWSGRISQLYHQMIERHGHGAAMGRPLMSSREFFERATDDHSIAPNLEPHPPLASFRDALYELEKSEANTRILMELVEDDEDVVAQAIVIVSPSPMARFQPFADSFRADGVLRADENTVRRVGTVRESSNVWRVVWD